MTFATRKNAAYAVIFTSLRPASEAEYATFAERIEALAEETDGFVAIESVRDAEGRGITVSYWRDLEAIARFRRDAEHRAAQQRGRDAWYARYAVAVCHIERAYDFDASLVDDRRLPERG